MEGRCLDLRNLPNATEHFTRTGKVEFALPIEFPQCREDVVRAVDVNTHRRKTVRETLSDKALGCEVITLIEITAADNVKNTRVAFEATRMQRESISDMSNPRQALLGLFKRYTSDNSVNFVAQVKQVFG